MVYVGTSTAEDFVSKAIRFFLRDNVSHTFLAFDMFDQQWVLEAGLHGVILVPMSKWEKNSKIVDWFPLQTALPDSKVIKIALQELGQPYDFGSLFGFIWTMTGKWLKLKVRNPWTSAGATICSELVARVLQRMGYSGAEKLDPEQTTPSDIQDFFYNQ
jgi:cell wall-associated NlpC family hydrolase